MGRDLITDFSHAQGDRITLGTSTPTPRVAGNQDFRFIDNRAFTGVAGQLRYWYDAGQTIVSGDTNGDKFADFEQLLAFVNAQRPAASSIPTP